MLVTLGVIAYNEDQFLPGLFKDINAQTYPHDMIELIFVDAMSEDGTRRLMNDLACSSHDFLKITVLENAKKTQPSGWNCVIKASAGDVIIRVDAHAHIPPDFIKKNIECIKSGENISGGPRPNIILEETPWKKTLLLAESSMFGSSIASYRRETGKKYVDSMFHAAYKKEVFDKVGLFNEKLIRTEDNELHYRMRKAGYRFCYDPEIKSYQYTRSTLSQMLRQKFMNGFWIGITAFICPGCLSLFHFVPFAFILGIIMTSILACLGSSYLAIAMWGTYLLLNFTISAVTILKNKTSRINFQLILPILFLLLHISYGLGTLAGIFKAPLKILFGWNR